MPRQGLNAEQLTDAAVRIADADGLAAVTIARVAAELGVRGPSLYNHIEGRAELINAIARRGYDEMTAALQSAAVGRSGPDAVRAIAAAHRAYALSGPGRYAATQRPLPDEPGAAALVGVMADALRAWDLEADAEIHAIRAVRSALHGFVTLELAGGFAMPFDLEESYARLVEMVVEGLGPPVH